MLVDATRKYPMAPLALPTREYMEHARALWEELDLYPLNVQSPWRLRPGRLDRPLGDLCPQGGHRDWELSGNDTLRASAQVDAGKPGAVRRQAEENRLTPRQSTCTPAPFTTVVHLSRSRETRQTPPASYSSRRR
jgi:hypothetical protein